MRLPGTGGFTIMTTGYECIDLVSKLGQLKDDCNEYQLPLEVLVVSTSPPHAVLHLEDTFRNQDSIGKPWAACVLYLDEGKETDFDVKQYMIDVCGPCMHLHVACVKTLFSKPTKTPAQTFLHAFEAVAHILCRPSLTYDETIDLITDYGDETIALT